MTLEEKCIVSAYTGYLMCDFGEVHKYIEKILGRPVWTHEMANPNVQSEIQEKSRNDFLKLCETNGTTTFRIGFSKDDNGETGMGIEENKEE